MAATATARLEVVGDHVVVIRAHGEFDLATSRTLGAALEDAGIGSRNVVLDLAGATFLDVHCLSLLLDAQRRLREAGRSVVVVNAPPIVQRLVEVLRIPDLIAM